MPNDDTNNPGYKTTELWLTTITGIVSTILGTTAPGETTVVLIIGLVVSAITYLICRTVFKISKLKYRPNEVVNFTVQDAVSDKQ
jgi:phosphotransferase system  glucose/maltose/N-acetylglucosamine-specific IIC component